MTSETRDWGTRVRSETRVRSVMRAAGLGDEEGEGNRDRECISVNFYYYNT